jgi:hypothetical protein
MPEKKIKNISNKEKLISLKSADRRIGIYIIIICYIKYVINR